MNSPSHPKNPGLPSSPDEGMLRGMLRAWNRFWFTPADPLPLGVIRIFAGVVVLYIHLIYSLDLMSTVGPDGWLDLGAASYLRNDYPYYHLPRDWTPYSSAPFARGLASWSVFFHIQDPGWIIATHVAFLCVMVLFTIGFATRLTAALTWFAVLCYIHRLPVMLYGMDTMMNILMVYLTIAPCGATLSVDRQIAKWWARKKGLPAPPVRPLVTANFALRMMQVHFCFIYMASGLSKLQGPAWWNGTALWGTLANYSFAPMTWPVYVEFLRFLCEHRWLWELIMVTGSYFTLVLEISFPYLVWSPRWRWLMVSGSILLHTGIGLIMGLTTFSLLMLCLVLSFVPASTHHTFVNLLRKSWQEWWGKTPSQPGTGSAGQPALAAGA